RLAGADPQPQRDLRALWDVARWWRDGVPGTQRRAGETPLPLPDVHRAAPRAGRSKGAATMIYCGHDHSHRERRSDWDDVGHAAEDFARHIARDAQRFATRIAGHASAFARDFAGEWRRFERHGLDTTPLGDDVRAVLKEVQTFVTEVVEGVDGLIERAMRRDGEQPSEPWSRIVTTREAT